MARGAGGLAPVLPPPPRHLLPASIKQPLVFWPQTQQAGRGRLHIFALTQIHNEGERERDWVVREESWG